MVNLRAIGSEVAVTVREPRIGFSSVGQIAYLPISLPTLSENL